MKVEQRELVIIGGGPAGLAAAVAAHDAGVRDILLLERDYALGGILNQCIHNGFGLHRFREELTGPEYAERYEEAFAERGIEARLDTMVIDLDHERVLTFVSPQYGLERVQARAVILAMGARERTRGAIGTAGTRPAGVLTAGTAQRLVNLEGLRIGKDVVILGSGDIGLIMARRMSYEGAKVHACIEIMETPGGLTRNIVQCLNDFNIPLLLSHTVTRINGRHRIESIEVAQVDLQLHPIPGTEFTIPCDTLLLSVGLIPENELSRDAGVELDTRTSGPVVDDAFQTTVPGIFACGNVLHIHDLVDNVSEEAERAGRAAARFIRQQSEASDAHLSTPKPPLPLTLGRGLRYSVPQALHPEEVRQREEPLVLRFRVTHAASQQRFVLRDGEEEIASARALRVSPGEMASLTLLPQDLARIRDDARLVLSMEPVLKGN